MPALTYSYAVDRVERLVSDATATLTPSPTLTPLVNSDNPCVVPGGEGSQFSGEVQPSRGYFVTGLPTDRSAAELVAGLEQYWTAQGYRVISDERPQNQVITVMAPDDFRVGVSVNRAGDLSVIAVAPCVPPA